ncbi:MAG: hypothetical protein JNK48_03310, partial [Bryobacterales bacterium]|nr:hypothetical protein [Bryobacterales bacterium]
MSTLFLLFFVTAILPAGTTSGILRVPLLFEENRGQAGDAAFVVPHRGTNVLFGDAVTYRIGRGGYRVEFAGAGKVRPVGELRHAARVNYYLGAMRQEGVPVFEAIRYRGLYAGVDLVYHGNTGELEYDFQVAPGADPRSIALRFAGVERMELSAQGNLMVTAGGETSVHVRPVAYQDIGGKRRYIPAYFRKQGDTVRFAVAGYDRRYRLTIDPVLKFAARLQAVVTGLAADSAGNTFLSAGFTLLNNETDFQLVKLDSTGKLVYKTVLGGFGTDTLAGIAADGQGNLFASGYSTSSNYPVNGAQCSGLTSDAFVSKLGPTGTLLASRCYGGTLTETVRGMALDNAGAPYIAGVTESADLPTTSPVLQGQKRRPNASQAFVAKFDPVSLALGYGTYFGNYADVTLDSMAVDPGGAVYLGGRASQQGFLLTPGAYQTTSQVSSTEQAPFLAKLNAAGNALVYSTWLPVSTSFSYTVRLGADESGQAYAFTPPPSSFGFSSPSYTRFLRFSAQGAVNQDKNILFVANATALDVDRQGNILLSGFDTSVATLSTDALFARPGQALVVKLDSAGNLLHASALPGSSGALRFAGNDMIVAVQPLCCESEFPTTAGAY